MSSTQTKPDYSGNWVLDSETGMEAMMKAIGKGDLYSKWDKTKESMTVEQKGDDIKYTIIGVFTGGKEKSEEFTIGNDFDGVNFKGETVNNHTSWDNNCLKITTDNHSRVYTLEDKKLTIDVVTSIKDGDDMNLKTVW